MSGHLTFVTDDLENVGQGQNLQKNTHFWHANISKKNFQRQMSLTIMGSQKYQRVSEFGIITANNYHHCFQQNFSIFHILLVKWKTKCYRSLRLFNMIRNVLQFIIEALKLYKNFARHKGVAAQLSLPSPDGKWVARKKMKTYNICGIMQPFFFILSPSAWENNGLLNKIL